jgi:hypothetical protein
MPVTTRSSTGPTKMTVTGVKRKFIEILDSDDDTTTVSTDSEFEPDMADEIEELKDDLKETEQSNEALIDIIIKERENVRLLQAELAETKEKYETLVSNVKEMQATCFAEFVCFSGMLVVASGIAFTVLYACNIHDNVLLNL